MGRKSFAIAALDADVGWETLLGKRDEIAGFGELATSDPLALAAERYAYMRKFAPAFLEAFEFNATDAGDDLKEAIALLRDQNRTGKRKLPDDPPMPFAAKHWPSLIIQDGQPQRRVYETAVVSTLRERLRAGDVWVDGSRDYRRFMAAYNFARRLKTLNGLTPYEYICKIWTSEPDRFILNPIHQMPGLNT